MGKRVKRGPVTPAEAGGKKDRGLRNYIAVLIILAAGIIVYSNQFHASFHYDDYKYVLENEGLKNLGNLSAVWHTFDRRKLTALSFAINYRLFDSSVVAYHVINVGIHLASALLLYLLVLLIFQAPEMRKSELRARARPLALAAGLIFAVHPVQTNAVSYIWERTASQATLFYLAAVVLWLVGRLRGRPWYFIGAFVAFVLAILTKENTVTVPLMWCLCELCFFGLWRDKKRLLWLGAACVVLVAATIPLYRAMTTGASAGGMGPGFGLPRSGMLSRGDYFLTEINVLRTYIRLLFVPVRLNLDYDYPISKTLFEARTLLSALLLAAILALAVRVIRRQRLVAFGIFWFFITLAPESSVIPISDVIVEYRLYLAMTGFAICIAALLVRYVRDARALAAAVAVVAALLGSLTLARNRVWANELSLWQDAVRKSPGKARAHVNLGYAYLQEGDYHDALEQNRIALRIEPTSYLAWYNMALAYSMTGKYRESVDCYERDIANGDPNPYLALCNLGITYDKLGQVEKAIDYFHRALLIKPDFLNSHYNLALAYIEKGDFEAARREIDTIRRLGYASSAAELDADLRSKGH